MRLLRNLAFLALLGAGICLIRTYGVDGDQPAPANAGPRSAKISTTLHRAIDLVPLMPEDRRPYARSLFGEDWADLDGDCRDTRAEVLARDSAVPVAEGCKVTRGQWLSFYDNKTWTKSFEVQIDHLVPLAEAWDSGAYSWDVATRLRYANDLGDTRALVPTTTALNYVKLADDPQSYVPKVNRCRYIASWLAVKLRWNLSADQREHDAIARIAKVCPDSKLTVTRAKTG